MQGSNWPTVGRETTIFTVGRGVTDWLGQQSNWYTCYPKGGWQLDQKVLRGTVYWWWTGNYVEYWQILWYLVIVKYELRFRFGMGFRWLGAGRSVGLGPAIMDCPGGPSLGKDCVPDVRAIRACNISRKWWFQCQVMEELACKRRQGYQPGSRAIRACHRSRSWWVSCQAKEGHAWREDEVTILWLGERWWGKNLTGMWILNLFSWRVACWRAIIFCRLNWLGWWWWSILQRRDPSLLVALRWVFKLTEISTLDGGTRE